MLLALGSKMMGKVLGIGAVVPCIVWLTAGCATGTDAGPTIPLHKDAAVEGGSEPKDAAADTIAETGSGETGSDAAPPDAPVGEAGPPDAPVCDATVTINELQTEGAEAEDEFVELYNGGSCAVQMADYVLYYRSATGTTDSTLWTATSSQTLGPGVFFVLGGAKFTAVAADFTMAPGASLGAAGGTLALKKGPTTIDLVGWGTAAYADGLAAPAPAASKSIGRHPDGADTDNNAADFTEGTPSPRKPN